MIHLSLLRFIFLTLFTILVYYICKSMLLIYRLRNVPGPRPRLPLIGNSWFFIKPNIPKEKYLHTLLTNLYEKHKKDGMAMITVGTQSVVFLFKAKYVYELLKNSSFIEKPNEYKTWRLWLGRGLVTSDGNYWKKMRKLINPTFHSEVLNGYIPTVNDVCFTLISKLKEFTKDDYFDIRPIMSDTTLNIIAMTMMGISLDEIQSVADYKKIVHDYTTTATMKNFDPINQFDFIYFRTNEGKKTLRDLEVLKQMTNSVIARRKIDFNVDQIKAKKRLSFLDLLLKLQHENSMITDEEIREEVDTVMFAGFDTTSTCLSWTLFLLGIHKSVQQKVKQELFTVFDENKRTEVTCDDLNRMVYLEWVIKESLRFYCPASLIGRQPNEEFEVNGFKFPKTTSVISVLYLALRDESVFENADQYIPERFEKFESFKNYFFPFATGPRNCIGQRFAIIQMKIILAHILRNFTVTSIDTEKDMNFTIAGVLTSLNPIRVKLTADSFL